jgi:hypothetical protein
MEMRDVQKAFAVHDGRRWLPGVPVEVPVYEFAWESYHSALNKAGRITLPAPALCERLSLSNRQGEWDLYDAMGCTASLYREFKGDEDKIRSDLLYLRQDLMANYLAQTRQALVWLLWGEREIESRMTERVQGKLQDIWSTHRHIHRHRLCWEPQK